MDAHIIGVFAASREGEDPKYLHLAYDLGEALARSNYALVNGGGLGLMEEVARGAIHHHGRVIAVQFTAEGCSQSVYATETHSYDKLGPRQAKILELAEAFVVLPGGIGTTFEAWEVLAKKQSMEMGIDVPLIFLSEYWEYQIYALDAIIKSEYGQEGIKDFFCLRFAAGEVIEELDEYFRSKE